MADGQWPDWVHTAIFGTLLCLLVLAMAVLFVCPNGPDYCSWR